MLRTLAWDVEEPVPRSVTHSLCDLEQIILSSMPQVPIYKVKVIVLPCFPGVFEVARYYRDWRGGGGGVSHEHLTDRIASYVLKTMSVLN